MRQDNEALQKELKDAIIRYKELFDREAEELRAYRRQCIDTKLGQSLTDSPQRPI